MHSHTGPVVPPASNRRNESETGLLKEASPCDGLAAGNRQQEQQSGAAGCKVSSCGVRESRTAGGVKQLHSQPQLQLQPQQTQQTVQQQQPEQRPHQEQQPTRDGVQRRSLRRGSQHSDASGADSSPRSAHAGSTPGSAVSSLEKYHTDKEFYTKKATDLKAEALALKERGDEASLKKYLQKYEEITKININIEILNHHILRKEEENIVEVKLPASV